MTHSLDRLPHHWIPLNLKPLPSREVPVLLSKGSRKANQDSHPAQSKRKRQHAARDLSASEDEDCGGGNNSDHEAPHALSSDQLEFTDAAEDGSSAGCDGGGRHRRSSNGFASGPMPTAFRMDDGLEEDGAVMALLGLCNDHGVGMSRQRSQSQPQSSAEPEAASQPSARRSRLSPQETSSCAFTETGLVIEAACPDGTAQPLVHAAPRHPSSHGQDDGKSPSPESAEASLAAQLEIEQWRKKQLSQSLEHRRKASMASLLRKQLSSMTTTSDPTAGSFKDLVLLSRSWEMLAEPMCVQVDGGGGGGAPWVPSLKAAAAGWRSSVKWQACAAPGCQYILSVGPYCCDHLSQFCRVRLARPSTQSDHLPHLVAGGDLECEGPEAHQVIFPSGSPIMAAPPRDDMGSSTRLHILDLAHSSGSMPNVEIKASFHCDDFTCAVTFSRRKRSSLINFMISTIIESFLFFLPRMVSPGPLWTSTVGTDSSCPAALHPKAPPPRTSSKSSGPLMPRPTL